MDWEDDDGDDDYGRAAEEAVVQAAAVRDERGQFCPGASGNPRGRPPGRPVTAVNGLADQALLAVLQHDLAAVQDGQTDPRERREALGRLARLGGRRVSPQQRGIVDSAGVEAIVAVLTRHIGDPNVLRAICSDLGVEP